MLCNLRDDFGMTAIDIARQLGRENMLEMLICSSKRNTCNGDASL